MNLISVIIPVYNVEKYLNRGVESVLCQTYKNFELLLVDDGSTDESARMCDEWAKKDERINVIHRPNGGVSSARNEGIKKARGEYLLFLDADDEFTSGLLEHCDEFIKKHEGIKVFNFSSTDYYENGTVFPSNIYKKGEYSFSSQKEKVEFFLNLARQDYAIYSSCRSCYKKSFLIDNRLFFDEGCAIGEDVIFNFRTFMLLDKYVETGFDGYKYDRRDNSCSASNKKIRVQKMNELSRKIYAFEKELGLTAFMENHHLFHYYIMTIVAFGVIQANKIADVKKYATNEIYFRDEFYVENTKKALKHAKVWYNEFRPHKYVDEKCRRALMYYSLNKNRLALNLRLFFLKVSYPFVRLNARIKRRLKGLFQRKAKKA